MKLKVYCLNDYDWWVGESEDEVKQDYLQMTGLPEDEAFDDFCELTENELEALTYQEEDGEIRTFKEQLDIITKANIETPCMFATTEY